MQIVFMPREVKQHETEHGQGLWIRFNFLTPWSTLECEARLGFCWFTYITTLRGKIGGVEKKPYIGHFKGQHWHLNNLFVIFAWSGATLIHYNIKSMWTMQWLSAEKCDTRNLIQVERKHFGVSLLIDVRQSSKQTVRCAWQVLKWKSYWTSLDGTHMYPEHGFQVVSTWPIGVMLNDLPTKKRTQDRGIWPSETVLTRAWWMWSFHAAWGRIWSWGFNCDANENIARQHTFGKAKHPRRGNEQL